MEISVNTEKLFYSIGEVAEMFNETVPTIRFWENNFKILKPKKNKKGNRLFTQEDIKNLQIIVHLLRDRGLTIKGAIQELQTNQDSVARKAELGTKLKRIKALLTEAYKTMDAHE